MKKLVVSILALAAFAACQSGFDGADVVIDAPQSGVNNGGAHTIYAEVGVGEETKATYGDDLKATWEEGDQIALLQEHADYGKTFSVVNKLGIYEGWGTSSASFNGDISVDATAPRVYHIAYPTEAVSFNVALSLSKVGDITYTTKNADSTFDGTMAYYSASADYKYTYNSTLNITVPTVQNGEWVPYMYASTSEAVSSNGIGAKSLTTLTGAIAIRAFETDGVTPKQLTSISIVSSDADLAGVFVGSSESSVSVNIQGAYTPDSYSTVSDNDINTGIVNWPGANKGRAAADELLTSAAQAYEPTSLSVTKAMSLSFVGGETAVTATNLEAIAEDVNGCYTYYLNVAPVTVGTLTIIANAVDGTTLVKSIDNQTFRASARKGYNLKWESAALTCGSIETWYDNYSTASSFNLAGSTIYANNLKVEGVSADHVLSFGLMVNGTLYGAQSGVLEIAQIKAEGLASGVYTAYAYAKVMVNGEEKELTAAIGSYNVTTVFTDATYVRSSYSNNGSVSLNNGIGGTQILVKVATSDSFVNSNLVKSVSYSYSGAESGSKGVTAGVELNHSGAKLGQYNCTTRIETTNGIVFSQNYTTHVTGLPFTMTTSSNADGWTEEGYVNWNTDGGVRLGLNQWGGDAYISKTFHIPASLTVKVSANGIVNGTGSLVKVENTATVTVGSTTVVSKTQKGNSSSNWSCSAASASMSSSNNTVKCNSSYNLEKAKVVVKALTIQY